MGKLNFDEIRAEAAGRWIDIFRALGIDVREDGKHGPCPSCGGKDRFRFDNKEGRGDYYCSGCGAGDGFILVEKVMSTDIRGAMEAVSNVIGSCQKNTVPKEKPISAGIFRKMFVESSPATGSDLVGLYLQSRGLSTIPTMLRYSKACWDSETKKDQRAMLAVVTLPDGTASTMHRTYLDVEGGKLAIEQPKKLMPVLVKGKGGAIRLMEPVEGLIGLAEGIESAIAASEDMNIPVWAAVSTAMMEAFDPPPDIKCVVIIADNDRNYAGQKSAYVLANKLVKKKIDAIVHVPDIPGQDWLDQYTTQGQYQKQRELLLKGETK